MSLHNAAFIPVAIRGSGLVLPDPAPSPLALPANMGPCEYPAYQHQGRRGLDGLSLAATRRLDRLQLLMLGAANLAVADAGTPIAGPSVGVFVGTALGSIGATVDFAENMIRLDEREPKPTKFINSIHNAAASAIAIQLGCKGESHTITHDATSLELAFLRAVAALQTGRIKQAIVVGGDELSGLIVAAMWRWGWWRSSGAPLNPLTDSNLSGTLPGEGAAAFILEKLEPGDGHRGVVVRSMAVEPLAATGVRQTDAAEECRFLSSVLGQAGNSPADVDLLIVGANGDEALDACYRSVVDAFVATTGRQVAVCCFKHACGEFFTAGSIGLALAVATVSSGKLAQELRPVGAMAPRAISSALVYNVFPNVYHSAFWVST